MGPLTKIIFQAFFVVLLLVASFFGAAAIDGMDEGSPQFLSNTSSSFSISVDSLPKKHPPEESDA